MLTTVRTLLATLAVAATLAACSASAAGTTGVATLESANPAAESSAEPSASLDPEAAALAFAECMREHGIDMPDPQVGGGGIGITVEGGAQDEEKMQAAMEACNHFLEDAAGERRELDPEALDRMVEFASCMREHGIDMPDPTTDGGRIMVRGNASSDDEGGEGPQSRADFFGADPSSPEFQEAEEACRPILGEFGPGDGPQFQTAPEPAQP